VSALAWVDVFAAGPMSGNPLAVVLDADDWTAARMQALAAELGISETAFVIAAGPGADHRVRIFTPVRELPMAGHPVVGTAWVLHAGGRTGERARLETGAGVMATHVRGGVATVALGPVAPGAEVDPYEAAHAVGLPSAAGARIWSVGVPQLMLEAPDATSVRDARPDHDALRRLGERDGWVGVSLYALDGSEGRLRADVRHFAPLLGVPEDPVTGSAAGALGGCVAAARAPGGGELEMVVRQTTAAGRGGEVAVRVEMIGDGSGRVRIGGRVVPLFEGRFVDEDAARGASGR
jgi:trans-2,3-dihydro-3-hydroxyanthranilate isomerase